MDFVPRKVTLKIVVAYDGSKACLNALKLAVKHAKEQKADQIIIGIKRRSKVGKLVFGSNAAYIVLHAHCPVVTTR